jgi:hypothetical protein
MRVFESHRIITPEISFSCNMTLPPAGLYHNTMVYSLLSSSERTEKLTYWLGLLNSKLWWFLTNTGNLLRGGYFRFNTSYLHPYPIHTIDFSDNDDAVGHDRMMQLVERMLSHHEQLAEVMLESERTVVQH